VDVNGGKAGVYASWFNESCYLDAVVGGGFNSYDTRRAAVGGVAEGSTEGGEFSGMLGGGYVIGQGHWTFGPTIALQYTYVGVDGFTETGSLSPLRISDNESQSLKSYVGGWVGYELPTRAMVFRPQLRLTWDHEYLDSEHAIDSSLASGAGSLFQANSPSLGRDSLGLGVGLSAQCSARVSAYVFYDGQFLRENYTSHAVSAAVNISF
jgi:outer membrane autotransporter protein